MQLTIAEATELVVRALTRHRMSEQCVRLPVGSTMVMCGGLVPHLIEPLAAGELRIVSILCFRVLAG